MTLTAAAARAAAAIAMTCAVALVPGDGGAGWNDISYVSNTQAWVVYGPADFSGIGQLWVTRDGGHHWAAVTL